MNLKTKMATNKPKDINSIIKNSTYARAIEARFQKDKIINQSLCFPCTNTCLNNETINNDITKIKLDDELSQRTINFVNRFKVLHYQPNTSSGFSATLFQNKQTKEYILSFRSTELSNLSQIWADLFATDIKHLLPSSTPKDQYDDMINFYKSCARDYPQIKEKDSLTLTGHSLGGYLAQRFCPIICYNQ